MSAGYIGLELGSVWMRLGANVTVIEMLPSIATGLDGQIGRKLQRVLKRQGIKFHLGSKVTEAKKANKKVAVTIEKKGKSETLSFDRLLVSVGRRPLTNGLRLEDVGIVTDPASGRIQVDASYRTSVPSIYAIGDLIAGPMLAHMASAEGVAAVECIAGLPGEVNYDAFPSAGVGRAHCLGETEGLVKILAHANSDRVIGVHIIGPRAADMIAECVLAVQFDAKVKDIARSIHGHPTFAEALQEAAAMARKH